jgi:hypothetical protein
MFYSKMCRVHACFTAEYVRITPPQNSYDHHVGIIDSKISPAIRHGGAWGEMRYSSYSFSTSALDEGEWSASRPGRAFTPGERTPGIHCTGGWVGPRAGLDTEDRGKIVCPRRGSNPGRPARSQTLYCLSYPGSRYY